MHIVITPNAFKGSLTAEETANCIAEGIRKSRLSCGLTLIPIADGGDGTAVLISQKTNSRPISVSVHDPLGKIIEATFWWVPDEKTAIIEMSEASGLRLLNKVELNPMIASTRGTGELIRAALEKGAVKLILGVGGSATVDGGAGLLCALGVSFLNENGKEITDLPSGLMKLKTISLQNLDPRLQSCEVVVLCDVRNTLLGINGAAAVFGPQKGANGEEVILLEKCMQRMNDISKQVLKVEMASFTYGGAAGGVAAGMAAFVNAKLVSGIEYFLDVVDFDKALQQADIVITAEGSLDAQTMEGKGPYGVAWMAKGKKLPVIIMAGQIPLKIEKELHNYFNVILSIGHAPTSIPVAIQNSADDLKRTSFELGNLLALKQN